MVESPVEVDGWGSALVTLEMWHKSNGCSTLTAADVADVVCVGCGVVYELVLLAAGTFLLDCNDAVIFKLGNAGKASSAPWRSRLCGCLPSCSVDVAPSEVWLQNVLEPFHWMVCRMLPWLDQQKLTSWFNVRRYVRTKRQSHSIVHACLNCAKPLNNRFNAFLRTVSNMFIMLSQHTFKLLRPLHWIWYDFGHISCGYY